MMYLKLLMAVMVACLVCPARGDVLIEDSQPDTVAVIPVIKSQNTEKPMTVVFEERIVTVEDPSTKTYPLCSQCSNKIPSGRHYILMQDGRKFCSQTCFKNALPECSVCGTRFMNGLIKDNHFICSQTCLAATWPKCQSPGCGTRAKVWNIMPENNEVYCLTCSTYQKCHSCLRPDRHAKDLKDGRALCRVCQKSAVIDNQEALALIVEVRDLMRNQLGIAVETKGVAFSLCGTKELRQVSNYRYPGQEPGTLRTHEIIGEKTDVEKTADGQALEVKKSTAAVRYEMVILNSLSKAKFIETAAHELAVLWLEMNYPHIGDYAVREGFGEWVASRVNELYGRSEMNIRMESNQDPYYGGGYRRVKQQIDRKGFDAFKKYLEALSNPEKP